MRIEDLLRAQARRMPERVAGVAGSRSVTFGALEERAERLARGLSAAGLRGGDRVIVALPNCLEFLDLIFATARANLVLVPLNPRSTAAEFARALADADAKAVVTTLRSGVLDGAAPAGVLVLEIDEEDENGGSYSAFLAAEHAGPTCHAAGSELDPWLLAFTSGSTGKPKGVVLSHRAKYLSAVMEALDTATTPVDVGLLNTPMFHVHGIVMALTLIAAGARSRLRTTDDFREGVEAFHGKRKPRFNGS